MTKKKAKTQHQNRSDSKFYQSMTFIQLMIVFGIIFILLIPFVPGQVKFYSKWVECGQKPVATAGPGFFGVGVSHYIQTPEFSFIRGTSDYFCTPLDAENAHYSANPDVYEFPHLNNN